MGYEDSVYLAKLAEQAERYEGMTSTARSTREKTRLIPTNRNGGEHEAGRICGSRALCRGTKPLIGCLQERYWGTTCVLEDRDFHRTKGGVQGQ